MTIRTHEESSTNQAPSGGPVVVVIPSNPLPWQESCLAQLRAQGVEPLVLIAGADAATGGGLVVDLRTGVAGPPAGPETWSLEVEGGWARLGRAALLGGRATIRLSLVRSGPHGREVLLASTLATEPTSVEETAERVRLEAARLPAHALRGARTAPDVSDPAPSARWRMRDELRLRAVLAWRRTRRAVRERTSESAWAVGVVDAPISAFLADPPLDRIAWNRRVRRGTYLADPFAVPGGPAADGTVCVLVEELDHVTDHGRLVATSYRPGAGWSGQVREVLTERGHLSYPSLVELPDRGLLLVPESAKAGAVRGYRLGADTRADHGRILLDGVQAGDPTLLHHEGRWWLFFTDCAPPRDTHLHIWFADSPQGPWQPHPMNPVKSDVTSSRPGGTPFVHDGRLFRPAQDDAGTYGRRMVVNEVHILTPERFEESVAVRLGPFGHGRYPWGPHTLSAAGPVTLLDGKRRVLRIRFAWARWRCSRRSPHPLGASS